MAANPRGTKYLSNVLKSIKYATIEHVAELNPVIVETYNTNKDFFKDTLDELKNKQQDASGKIDIKGTIKDTYANMKEDLKSGKFYNKERAELEEEKAMSDVFGIDMSFGGLLDDDDFDEYDNITSNLDDDAYEETSSSSNIDPGIAKLMEKTSAATLMGFDSSSRKSARALGGILVENSKLNANVIFGSTERVIAGITSTAALIHQDLTVMNQNIANLASFTDNALRTHIDNSATFYETQKQQLQEQTDIMKEILSLQKSVYKPATKIDDKTKISDIFGIEGGIDLAAYKKYISENNKGAMGYMGGMIADFLPMLTGDLKGSPLKYPLKALIKKATPKAAEKMFESVNDLASGIMSTALLNLTQVSKNSNFNFFHILGEKFGLKVPDLDKMATNKYNKGPTAWTGKDHKALTDVIPKYLSDIYSAISGKEAVRYDYERGKFMTIGQIREQYKKNEKYAVGSANRAINTEISTQLNKINFSNSEEKNQIMNAIEKIQEYNFKHMKKFNPNSTDPKELDPATYGITGPNADSIMQIVKMLYNSIDKKVQLKGSGEYLTSISRYDRELREREAAGDSLFNSLFDDSIDENKIIDTPVMAAAKRLDYTNIVLGEIRDLVKAGTTATLQSEQVTSTIAGIPAEDVANNDVTGQTTRQNNTTANKNTEGFSIGDDPSKLEEMLNTRPKVDEEMKYTDRIKSATRASDKLKEFFRGFELLLNKPFEFMLGALDTVDRYTYRLFFGDGTGNVDSVTGKIKEGFDNLFSSIGNKVSDTFSAIKDEIKREGKASVKGIVNAVFGVDLDSFARDLKEGLFGGEDVSFLGGMGKLLRKGMGEMFSDIVTGVKSSFTTTEEGERGGFAGDALRLYNEERNKRNQKEEDKKRDEKAHEEGQESVFDSVQQAARGLKVKKTGLVAVSKGERIIPDSMDPAAISSRDNAEKTAIGKFKNALGLADVDIENFARGGKYTDKLNRVVQKLKEKPLEYSPDMTYEEFNKFYETLETDEERVEYSKKFAKDFTRRKANQAIERGARTASDIQTRVKDFTNQIKSDNPALADAIERESQRITESEFVQNTRAGARRAYSGAGRYARSMRDKATEVFESAVEDIRTNDDDFSRALRKFIDRFMPEKGSMKKVSDDIVKNWKQYLPMTFASGAMGAGISMLTGMIGGPLLGAAVGSAIGLTSKSNAIQQMLFGDKIVDEDGNLQGYTGNMFSKDVSNAIMKYAPDMVKSGIGGMALSMMPFVPGGPVAGLMIGGSLGYIKNNEDIQDILFGSKTMLKDVTGYVKKQLPAMGLGALAGIVAGPFGLTTNMILGSTLGLVSDTEKFKNMIFGYKDFDGKRHGGLVGIAKKILAPPLEGLNTLVDESKKFFKDEILGPLSKAIRPIFQEVENLFTRIGDAISNSISDHITRPIGNWLTDKLLVPIEKKLLMPLIKIPFKLMRRAGRTMVSPFLAISRGLERRQLNRIGFGSGSASDRIVRRQELIDDYNEQTSGIFDPLARIPGIGNTILTRTGRRNAKARIWQEQLNNSASARADEYVTNSNTTVEELARLRLLHKAIGPSAIGKKNGVKAFAATIMKDSSLVDRLNSLASDDRHSLPYKYIKTITKEVENGECTVSVKLVKENTPNMKPEDRERLVKLIKDAAKKVREGIALAENANEEADRIKAELGFDIRDKGFGRVLDRELHDRGMSREEISQIKPEEPPESEQTPEYKHLRSISTDLSEIRRMFEEIYGMHRRYRGEFSDSLGLNDNIDGEIGFAGAVDHQFGGDATIIAVDPSRITSVWNRDYSLYEGMFEDTIHDENRRKETLEYDNDVTGFNVGTGDSIADVAQITGAWAGEEMPQFGGDNSTNADGTPANGERYQYTENGMVRITTNDQGEQEVDEQDSETRETLRRRDQQQETQTGILGKLSGIGTSLLDFFSGDKEEEKPSVLSKILKVLGLGFGFLGGGKLISALKIAGGVALGSYAWGKLTKEDENGVSMADKIGEKLKEVGGTVWDKATGWWTKTAWPWLKNTGWPTMQEGFQNFLETACSATGWLTSTLVSLTVNVVKGLVAEGWDALGKLVGFNKDKNEKMDNSTIESNEKGEKSIDGEIEYFKETTVENTARNNKVTTPSKTSDKIYRTKGNIKTELQNSVAFKNCTEDRQKLLLESNLTDAEVWDAETDIKDPNGIPYTVGELCQTKGIPVYRDTESGLTVNSEDVLRDDSSTKRIFSNYGYTGTKSVSDEERSSNTGITKSGIEDNAFVKIGKAAALDTFTKGTISNTPLKIATAVTSTGSSALAGLTSTVPIVGKSAALGMKVNNAISLIPNRLYTYGSDYASALSAGATVSEATSYAKYKNGTAKYKRKASEKMVQLSNKIDDILKDPDAYLENGKSGSVVNAMITKVKEYLKDDGLISKACSIVNKGIDIIGTGKKVTNAAMKSALDKFAEKLRTHFKSKLGKFIGTFFAGKVAKLATALGTAGVEIVASIVGFFIKGYKKAEGYFEVTECTFGERIISGFVNVVCDLLLKGLFSTHDIIDFFTSAFDKVFDFSELEERRKQLTQYVAMYNEQQGTNLSEYDFMLYDDWDSKIARFVESNPALAGTGKGLLGHLKGLGATLALGANTVVGLAAVPLNAGWNMVNGDSFGEGFSNAWGTYTDNEKSLYNLAVGSGTQANKDIVTGISDQITGNYEVANVTETPEEFMDRMQENENQLKVQEVADSFKTINDQLTNTLNATGITAEGSNNVFNTNPFGSSDNTNSSFNAFGQLNTGMTQLNDSVSVVTDILNNNSDKIADLVSKAIAIRLGLATADDDITLEEIINDKDYLSKLENAGGVSLVKEAVDSVQKEHSVTVTMTQPTADMSNFSTTLPGGKGSGISRLTQTSINPAELSFVSQKYGKYANMTFGSGVNKQTVSDAGCAPTAAMMAINANVDKESTIGINEALKTAGGYISTTGGVTADYFADEFARHGFKTAYVPRKDKNQKKILLHQLSNGVSIVLMGKDSSNRNKKKSPFGPTYHYVVATGLSDDGKYVFINDPETNEPNKKYLVEDIFDNADLSIIPMKTNSRIGSLAANLKSKLKQYSGKATPGIIFVGDSRTVGLQQAVGNSDKKIFIAESGKGLAWLKSNIDRVKKAARQNSTYKVVVNMGVNDLNRIDSYISYYKELLTSDLFKDNLYFMSVNPVNEDKYHGYSTNARIHEFNDKYKAFAGAKYIDICSQMEEKGFTDRGDGLHYSKEEYTKIYNRTVDYFNEVGETVTSPDGTSGTTKSTKSIKTIGDLISAIGSILSGAYGLSSSEAAELSGDAKTNMGKSTTINVDGISGTVSSDPEVAQKQKELVAKMASIKGKIAYSMTGPRDPEQGSADCSSTVQWAYKKIMGKDIGSWTGAQETSNNTSFIDKPHSTRAFDESKLQLGDILLYGQNAQKHVEMYYGDGKVIGHGGPDKGTKVRDIGSVHTGNNWSAKRLKEFMPGGKGSGIFVSQKDSEWANRSIGDEKVSVAGCAPAVATMAINNTQQYNMKQAIRDAEKYKAPNKGGVSAEYFIDTFKKQGYNTIVLRDKEKILNVLANGKSVVLIGSDKNNKSKRRSPFGSGTHYVLATGVSADRKWITISDPELDDGGTRYKTDLVFNGVILAIVPVTQGSNKLNDLTNSLRDAIGELDGRGNSDLPTSTNPILVACAKMTRRLRSDAKGTWTYHNNGSKGANWSDALKRKLYKTNCALFAMWALKDAGIMGQKSKNFYGKSAKSDGWTWTDDVKEEVLKTCKLIMVNGAKSASTMVKNGEILPGDVISYSNYEHHTNIYAGGGNKWYDAGHEYCSGSGEGAVFNDWYGTQNDPGRVKSIIRYVGGATPVHITDTGDTSDTTSTDITTIGEISGSTVLDKLTSAFGNLAEAWGLSSASSDESTTTDDTGTAPGDSTGELTSVNIRGNNDKEKIWNYLRDKGVSKEGTAALMGNFQAESGNRFNNLEDQINSYYGIDDAEYTKRVDNNTYSRQQFLHPKGGTYQYGYGLAQWTSEGRKAGLYDSAKSNNTSIADPKTQMDWLWHELSTDYVGVLNKVKNATNIQSASNKVLYDFESPANASSMTGIRASYGQAIYNELAGKGSGLNAIGIPDSSKTTIRSINRINKGKELPKNTISDKVNVLGKGTSSIPITGTSSKNTIRSTGSSSDTSTYAYLENNRANNQIVVAANNSDKSSVDTNTLLKAIVNLLTQEVKNTAFIEGIASAVVTLVDAKANSTDDASTKKQLLDTKTQILTLVQQQNNDNASTSLSDLIKSMESIIAL